jgi:uncharacterized Ntn-hydrolase superfamily protein
MTWSMIARDPATGAFGAIVATRFFAVGALCTHAMSGVGALSTQALVNPTYGPRGMALLAEGRGADAILAALLADDEGREHRQLHLIDRAGRIAQHTGASCIDWAGHRKADGVSVAGNMLAGPQVVEATLAAYLANTSLPFAERLHAGMVAGEAAGGDKRGKQSAALKIYTSELYPDLDLRVDDHADPLPELARLIHVYRQDFELFKPLMPTIANPSGVLDPQVIADLRAKRLAALEKLRPGG